MNDLKFTIRQLLKSPGFTAVAVISLALGIGANTAIFSLVNAIVLRSLPVPNPHELRLLTWSGFDTKIDDYSGNWNSDEAKHSSGNAFSFSAYANLRKAGRDLADLVGYLPLRDCAVRGQQRSFIGQGYMVSDNYFSTLGINARIGRLISTQDDADGATPVAVISHEVWSRDFNRDPTVLEKPLLINGNTFTIIGVLPAEFPGITPANPPDFYVSMNAQPQLAASHSRVAPGEWWLQVMARLKNGTSDKKFQAAMQVVFEREASAFMRTPNLVIKDGRAGPSGDRNHYRKPLMMLLGIVSIVLLVACANLAGLLLARGMARQHELAVCAAIGASRWRLMRRTLCESLVLSGLGGALGVVFAFWGRTILSQLLAGNEEGLHYDTSFDIPVMIFTAATMLGTALLAGLFPAIRSASVSPVASLNTRLGSGATRQAAGRFLVTAQIALSTVLLTGAILYAQTLVNLTHINPGFDAEQLVLFQLNPGAAGYNDARKTGFYDEVQRSLSAIPGVKSATVVQFKLLSWTMSGGQFFTLPGYPTEGDRKPNAFRLTVGENFFKTMSIPVLSGRDFQATDKNSAVKVVVVNKTFANKYFSSGDAIGKTMEISGAKWQIVGVCSDAKYHDIKADAPPTVYFSFRQSPTSSSYFALRTALPPSAVINAARDMVSKIDPDIPLYDVTTQAQVRNANFSQERLFSLLCGALAGLAVLLACIGLAGLMAYNVTRRTGEIGIRLALGATRQNIAGRVFREALLLGGIGIVAGTAAALALSRLIKSQLYGVEANDPITMILTVSMLLLVALGAAWLPARRASLVDPMTALRNE